MRSSFRQANREAAVTLVLYVFFFLWWTFFAFGMGAESPEEYSYVWGLPSWFFFSCVLGYPAITFLLWAAVRFFFTDIPLDSSDIRHEEAGE